MSLCPALSRGCPNFLTLYFSALLRLNPGSLDPSFNNRFRFRTPHVHPFIPEFLPKGWAVGSVLDFGFMQARRKCASGQHRNSWLEGPPGPLSSQQICGMQQSQNHVRSVRCARQKQKQPTKRLTWHAYTFNQHDVVVLVQSARCCCAGGDREGNGSQAGCSRTKPNPARAYSDVGGLADFQR